MKSATPFVHLRVHTAYSLSEGAVRINELVAKCRDYAMPAVAIADSNNLFGALEFSKACAGAGIQPIVGCLFSIQAEEEKGNFQQSVQAKPDQLVCYAQSEEGYENLLHLMAESYLNPVGGEAPLLSLSQFEGYASGIIALTAGTQGAVGRHLLAGRVDKARVALLELQALFPDRLYIELQRHGLDEQEQIEAGLIELAYDHDIPLVATNDVYFPDRQMYEAHDALLCIAGGRYVAEEERHRLTPEHYLKSPQEMVELFSDLPEAIENTAVIAQRCAYMAEERAPMLPGFDTGEGRNEEEEFCKVARDGLDWRLEKFVYQSGMPKQEKEKLAEEYKERLEFELSTIIRMQFPGYFLIVSDFIRWSKEHNIPVGPGRGSGAGSLVAWAMSITDLDPIRYGLLFERFLNPERVSMPDFDVDFCQDRRDEVIRYVQEKYGRDRVAQIITFGKLQARAVLRDVGRVLQLPYPQVDRICKLVPNNPAAPVTLPEAISMEPMLRKEIADDEDVAQMVAIARKLEGLNRHSSTHAAGVVIADRPLEELIPLYRDPRSDMPVVQFSMKYAEMAGLVKFDFLGLKTLTVLSTACRFIREGRGEEIDLLTLPLDDAPSYEMLGKGDTVGVFQLESAGMRDTLRKLKPDSIEDIIALVSLYRPGPMDNIPTYVARKHGKEEPEYPHPMLEEILAETFGVIIYQEQVMQIAQVMGGYSLGQADLLRRAMGKKIKAEMDKQRDIFVEGALKKDVSRAKATEVFDLMAKFASYGFNKSHAAAYAFVAYQTAYLKANFPEEMLAASMALDVGNTDKLSLFRQDAILHGIEILPPDINLSFPNFVVEKQKDGTRAIRYALGALKNVGINAMEALVAEREANGAFTDMWDVAERLDSRVMNKRQLEYLVKAGVFDSLDSNRRRVFTAIDVLVAHNAAVVRDRESNQVSLFGEQSGEPTPRPSIPEVPEWPVMEKMQYEFDAVGFYLTAHPLDSYGDLSRKLGVVSSDRFAQILGPAYTGLSMAGIVLGRKVKVSPKGRFAFLTISDPSGIYEVSVFDEELLNNCWSLLEPGTALHLTGEGKADDSGVRLIVQGMQPLDQAVLKGNSDVTIQLDASVDIAALKAQLGTTREKGQRGASVQLVVPVNEQRGAVVKLPGIYALTPPVVQALESLDGVRSIEQK